MKGVSVYCYDFQLMILKTRKKLIVFNVKPELSSILLKPIICTTLPTSLSNLTKLEWVGE